MNNACFENFHFVRDGGGGGGGGGVKKDLKYTFFRGSETYFKPGKLNITQLRTLAFPSRYDMHEAVFFAGSFNQSSFAYFYTRRTIPAAK